MEGLSRRGAVSIFDGTLLVAVTERRPSCFQGPTAPAAALRAWWLASFKAPSVGFIGASLASVDGFSRVGGATGSGHGISLATVSYCMAGARQDREGCTAAAVRGGPRPTRGFLRFKEVEGLETPVMGIGSGGLGGHRQSQRLARIGRLGHVFSFMSALMR